MNPRRLLWSAIAASLVAGTLSDDRRPSVARTMGEYHVLAGDFHVHAFPQTWSTLAPWDTVIDAGRQGLDVIALTPHDQIWQARVGRWFADRFGGPLVIVGEEIVNRGYHLLGIGLTRAVPSGLSIHDAIAAVHAQGGVAVVAHPYDDVWPTFDEAALAALDGAEVVRPEAQHEPGLAGQLHEFFGRAPLTAFGNSDYHGLGPVGYTRTYLFARTRDEAGVIEALREGRTVVYGRDRVYGDPALIELAAAHGGLPADVPALPVPGVWRTFSRLTGILALLGLVLTNGVYRSGSGRSRSPVQVASE